MRLAAHEREIPPFDLYKHYMKDNPLPDPEAADDPQFARFRTKSLRGLFRKTATPTRIWRSARSSTTMVITTSSANFKAHPGPSEDGVRPLRSRCTGEIRA